MRNGRYKHRVVYLEPVAVSEDNGGERIEYVPRFRRWSAVEPIKGAEALRANQPLAVMDTRILARHTAAFDSVTEKWRALHRGTLYDLVSVVNVRMSDRDVEIMAKSGAI